MRLFCKTWEKDWPWLKVAMVSVLKRAEEQVDWTIVVDNGTKDRFQAVIDQVQQAYFQKKLNVRVFEVSEHWSDANSISSGYIQQQWIKMTAHRVMETGYFWNWDSDVIAQKEFTSLAFIGNSGKPIHWITQFNAMMDGPDRGAHEARKGMLREIFGLPDLPWEYMRCMPMPMMAEVLRYGENSSYWAKALELCRHNDNRISEFNIIGLYSHLYFLDVFDWRNTQNYDKTFSGPWGDKNYIVSQGWSHGGLPEGWYHEIMKL